jgi:capsular polysaccharide biosynthesis protein
VLRFSVGDVILNLSICAQVAYRGGGRYDAALKGEYPLKQSEINVRDIFAELLHRSLWIILATIVAAAAVFIYSEATTVQTYSATVSLFVTNTDRSTTNEVTYVELRTSSLLVDTYIVILKSNTVLNKVADNLGVDLSAGAIRGMMTAEAIDDTEAFNVTISCADKELAVNLANEIAKIAPDEIRRVVQAGETVCIDQAETATMDSNGAAAHTVLGGIIGFVVSCIIVILAFTLDTKIWDEADLEKAL